MKTGYELRNGGNGKWEVSHCREDGTTVKVGCFRTEKEAWEYLKGLGYEGDCLWEV